MSIFKHPRDSSSSRSSVVGSSSLWPLTKFSWRQYGLIASGLLALAGGIVLFAATPNTPSATPVDGGVALSLPISGTPFASSSFWDTSLPASTPTNPNSPTYVSDIVSQLGSANGNVNTSRWSVPFYVVPANQPRVPIILNCNSPNCNSATADVALKATLNAGVPIPADAQAAGGTDAHIAVYQPSTNTLWEFWRLSTPAQNAPGAGTLSWSSGTVPSYGDNQWHTVWGGVMNTVSQSNGIFPYPYGGWTTGLPLLGSVVRIEELQAGQVNHVVSFSLSNLLASSVAPANTAGAANGISWPADRSDGTNTNSLAVPEGTRFRLPANLDLSKYGLSPIAKTIAVAAQKYGLVLTATGSPVSLFLGDPTPYITAGLPNPYTNGPGVGGVGSQGLFNGAPQSSIMQNFPWSQLQALPYNYGEFGATSAPSTPVATSSTTNAAASSAAASSAASGTKTSNAPSTTSAPTSASKGSSGSNQPSTKPNTPSKLSLKTAATLPLRHPGLFVPIGIVLLLGAAVVWRYRLELKRLLPGSKAGREEVDS